MKASRQFVLVPLVLVPLLLFVFTCARTSAQTLSWGHTISRDSDDLDSYPSNIAIDRRGNVYVGCGFGDRLDLDGVTFSVPDGRSSALMSYSRNGDLRWITHIDSKYHDFISDIIVAGDGNPVFVWLQYGGGGDNLYLTKVNSETGEVLWQRLLAFVDQTVYGYGKGKYYLGEDGSGGYVVGCSSNKDVYTIAPGTVDTTWYRSSKYGTLYLLNADEHGYVSGVRQIASGDVHAFRLRNLATTADGSILCTGEFFRGATFDTIRIRDGRDYDFFTASFTRDGAVRWVVYGGGISSDSEPSMAIGADGSVYHFKRVGLNTRIVFGDTTVELPDGDYLWKIDRKGSPQWFRSDVLDDVPGAFFRELTTNDRGEPILLFFSQFDSLSIGESPLLRFDSSMSGVILWIDSSGNVLRGARAPGDPWEISERHGATIVAGDLTHTVAVDGVTMVRVRDHHKLPQFYVAQMGESTAGTIESNRAAEVSSDRIGAVALSGTFQVDLMPGDREAIIVDMAGAVCRRIALKGSGAGTQTETVDVHDLPRGAYLVTIAGSKGLRKFDTMLVR